MKKEDRKRSFLERLAASQEEADVSSTQMNVEEDSYEEDLTPATSLEEEFQSIEEDFQGGTDDWSAGEEANQEGQLTLDVYQTNEAIVLKSTIAGVKSKDLDVSITNDMVSVRGVRRNPDDIPADQYFYQECYWGPFSRTVILPVDVLAEEAAASLKDGILTIILPKKIREVSHTISVIED